MLRVFKILFPIVTGAVVTGLSTALTARPEAYTDDVVVQPKRPSAPSLRMVTVRDDGGPTDGPIQRHGYGFNVWAETSTNAELLARMCMALIANLPDGAPIVQVSNMTGPFEVLDEGTDLLTVGTTTLSHFYFAAQISARGADL